MHGNVFEWYSDWYGDYPTGSVTDPQGATNGSERVNRGGSWAGGKATCRAASRYSNDATYRSSSGLRLTLSPFS
ncbi:MAG TPA: hypothetical protein DDZ51_19160 [Planctomycetaceae bacterium]|nr:hypothetical protein [Planctomycetaceae bacterium]